MVNVTLSIPQDLKIRMDDFAEINWSAVAREAFNEKIRDLDIIRKFKERSKFTEEDAIRLGKELSENLVKKRHT